MLEIELKLLLDEAGERRLRRAAGSSGLPSERASTKRLTTIYFDTPGESLARDGIVLRLRRKGNGWEQTVKLKRQKQGGLSRAVELNTNVPSGDLDLEAIAEDTVRRRIAELVNGTPLEAVFQTQIRRTSRVFHLGGCSRVELSIDNGKVVAGEAQVALREAELELIEGDPAALFDLARALFDQGGLVFSTLSKAERARMLLHDGRIAPPLAPRHSRSVSLSGSAPLVETARSIMAECLEQIAANLQVILADDRPEGPHQMRVGLRRLRAAVKMMQPGLNHPKLQKMSDEARWLGAEVGRLRDLDVLLRDLVQPDARHHPEEPGYDDLIDALETAGVAERLHLRQALTGRRAQRFLLDLAEAAALLEDGPGLITTLDFAAPVLDMARSKARRRAGNLDTLTIDERHALRKSLKTLRYVCEFLAPLYDGKTSRRFLKQLKKMQTVFGDLNDAAMAEMVFTADDAPGARNPVAMRAAGRVIGARIERAEQAWGDAKRLWRSFDETPVFWR